MKTKDELAGLLFWFSSVFQLELTALLSQSVITDSYCLSFDRGTVPGLEPPNASFHAGPSCLIPSERLSETL